MATVLRLRKSYPKGGAAYGIDGLRGSIYINKSMLTEGEPPAEIEVSTDGVFAPPGSNAPKVNDPERLAKMQEAALKQEARLQKQQEKLAKMKERLAKAGVAATPEVETANV